MTLFDNKCSKNLYSLHKFTDISRTTILICEEESYYTYQCSSILSQRIVCICCNFGKDIVEIVGNQVIGIANAQVYWFVFVCKLDVLGPNEFRFSRKARWSRKTGLIIRWHFYRICFITNEMARKQYHLLFVENSDYNWSYYALTRIYIAVFCEYFGSRAVLSEQIYCFLNFTFVISRANFNFSSL